MKKVAIFMSDFHLGQNDQMEEFHTDNEFAELLGRLSFVHADDEVDLVLLGDVIDLWTAINAAERNAATPKDVDLYLPVDDPLAIPTAIDKEIDKATKLYEKAANMKGKDAMEILDIEMAKEELEDE